MSAQDIFARKSENVRQNFLKLGGGEAPSFSVRDSVSRLQVRVANERGEGPPQPRDVRRGVRIQHFRAAVRLRDAGHHLPPRQKDL
ncbi:hypothetical protein CDAR_269721 [Caerostris darwini]|uniref:Uncharacterized protein n=1 Tax=Caerostris darwini TaxID=1538125 RepID=A0AAV4SIA4_9ARAC|nr:hypothetical protein CDAR_269721 [Caerostris darwini]